MTKLCHGLKLGLLLFIFTLNSHADIFSESIIGKNIIKEVSNISISTSVDILDIASSSSLSTDIKYKYKVEPSFLQNKFLRIDEWVMQTNLNVGDVLDLVSPVHFNVNKGSKIIFIRNFASHKESLLARPYFIDKLPYNAKTVMERLNVGDFVSMPANLTVNLGISSNEPVFPYAINAGLGVVASGVFTTNIYKVDENRVRLKLIAQTNNGSTGSAKMESKITFTGLSIVDDKIEKILEFDLFEAYKTKMNGEQYVLDYVFDLSNEQARLAFDAILNPKKKLYLSDLITKYSGVEYIENKLVSDYQLAEELHTKKNGVERIFKGFNKFSFKKSGVKVGFLFSKASAGKAYFKNNITIEDEFGIEHSFFFPNRIHFYEEQTRLLFLKRKDKFETSFYGLIPVTNSDNVDGVANLGISHWREDDFLYAKEWKKVKQELVDLLPYDIVKDIDFYEFDNKTVKQNSKLKIQILFKEGIFDELGNVSFETVHETLKDLVKERNIITKTKLGKFIVKRARGVKQILGIDALSIYNFSKQLHKILTDPKLDAAERVSKFLALPDSYIFKRYGTKLIYELLDQSKWSEYTYIDLELYANDTTRISYTLGKLEFSQIFKEILKANKEFYSPSNDMRIIVEE